MGKVQATEPLELLEDVLLVELDVVELLEVEEEVLELDDVEVLEVLEVLDVELVLDELELDAGGSPPQATRAEDSTKGAIHRPKGVGVNVIFIYVTKCICLKLWFDALQAHQ